MAVVIPFDLLFADRAAAAIRFWNSVMDNRAGPEPKPLTPYARGQLILAIRLLDAERDGASEREMAEYVLNERTRTRRDWLATEHRSRLLRLLAKGHKLLRGGYLQILCPPPPRRRSKGKSLHPRKITSPDRKRAVAGKSVTVRLDLEGRRLI